MTLEIAEIKVVSFRWNKEGTKSLPFDTLIVTVNVLDFLSKYCSLDTELLKMFKYLLSTLKLVIRYAACLLLSSQL